MNAITILVVDDEADTRHFIVNLLKQQNYQVDTVASGEDALVYFEEYGAVDILLLDIMMPGLDGFDVLEMIKGNPKTQSAAVIMLTAVNHMQDKIKAFELGAADYLEKPFDKGELLARLRTQANLKLATNALVASEEKYRTIIDHANDLILLFKDIRCIFANAAVERVLGYAPAEVVKMTLDDMIPPDLLPTLKDRHMRRLAGQEMPSVYTLDMRHKNGHHIPLEVSVSLININNEVMTQVVARDFTERKLAEEQINALARFSTESPHPIIRIAADGQLMYSNIAGLDLLHDPATDQINSTISAEWLQIVLQILRTNECVEIESEHYGRIYSCAFVPFLDLGYVNMYGTDITERIQAEKALRKSEARYRILAENVRDLIAKLTLDGVYTYVSPACLPILGYPAAELLGQSFFDLIHPDDLAEVYQMEPPLLHPDNDHPFTLRFRRKDGSFIWLESSLRGVPGAAPTEIELVMVARDVTERKRYETALQQAYDEMEKRVEYRTAALTRSNNLLQQVIEERKQAEARIMQFNHELLTLQYAGAAIASSLDLQYVLHTVTREMVDLLKVEGCAISEWDADCETILLIAKHSPAGWWTNGPLAPPALVRDVLVSREYRQLTVADQFAGNIKTLLVMPLVFQDQVVGCIEIADSRIEHEFTHQQISLVQLLASQAASAIENAQLYQHAQQEITERKKAEVALEEERATLARRVEERTAALSTANAELSRAARLKDEFLASMSHELRTPLNAILSMSEALQEEVYGALHTKQLVALKNIEESGRHLLALINDILDLSKIDAGKLDLQFEPVSVESVCRASLLFIKQLAHKKQIKVQARLPNRPITIKADERRLKQILVNLLSNAVKFTPDGGEIGLEVTPDEQQQAIHFTVWDTGIGIPSDKIDSLFQPFVQLDSKLSRRYAGTGLGLALVRRMVDLHGGSITLTSTEGVGSRFMVSLPYQQATPAAAAPSPPAVNTMSIRQVLIIEDAPVVAEQYARYLHETGLEATVCHKGADTLETARRVKPDVIILDIMLPDRIGWEVLAELKKHPDTRHIPVLIASVMDDDGNAQNLGAETHLVKPISRMQLQQALKNIDSKRAALLPAASPPTSSPPPADIGQTPILLAEDNEINLKTMLDYLTRAGYRVIVARNGQEAIARAKETGPKLILMDIQMPDMDGLEAIQRLRAMPQFTATPIIALTALAMPGDSQRCLQAGADDYITKPVSLKGLVATIEAKLKQQPVKG